MPQIFSNGHKIYLVYLVKEDHPNWDGTYVTIVDSKSEAMYPLALVEFISPHTYRFGTVNDEAAHGHPLYGKGLDYYEAHLVENSTWIEELKNIHQVHPGFRESYWTEEKHYLLFFHDALFEIIARGFTIEVYHATFKDLATEVINRLYT